MDALVAIALIVAGLFALDALLEEHVRARRAERARMQSWLEDVRAEQEREFGRWESKRTETRKDCA